MEGPPLESDPSIPDAPHWTKRDVLRKIIVCQENNEGVPVYVPGTIHCMDDKSPPWAFLTEENNCVREMRNNFIFHKAAPQFTPIMEPATVVLQNEILSKLVSL